MAFLLTNDDGIDAPGIQALWDVVVGDSAIVAPQHQHSGCGHTVTTTLPITVDRRSPTQFAVAGTPADCVRLGLTHLYPQTQCVLSGINAGGNLGTDVYMSGTVAAVREAALMGIPGIAISHFRRRPLSIDWSFAAKMAAHTIAELLARPLPPGSFWNVNLPHLDPASDIPEVVYCPPCKQPLPASYTLEGETYRYSGRYGDRQRDPGADTDVCFNGKIAVTQLSI